MIGQRICPNCGKPIPRLPTKPRDLGLLLHTLTFRVPVEEPINEAWIETARRHCHMSVSRLAELRAEPHTRHWRYMAEKRARRLAWMQEHGIPPPYGWTPPVPGIPEHTRAVVAMRLYWKKVRPIIAKLKRRPDAQRAKMLNRYLATRNIRSRSRRLGALNDVEARLVMQWDLEHGGRMSVRDFLALQGNMLADNALPRRFNKPAKTDLITEKAE